MTRPTAPPPDPSSTFVDEDADEPKTTEVSTPLSTSTETTAAELPPVQSTDATFPELAPAPAIPTAAITQPVAKSRKDHPVAAGAPPPADTVVATLPVPKSKKDHPVVPPPQATVVGASDAALPSLAQHPTPRSKKDHAAAVPAQATVVGPSDAALPFPTPDTDASLPPIPSGIAKRETVVSASDAALPPMQLPLPEKPRVQEQANALTTEQDPDPRAFIRLWLVIPRYRTQRRIAGAIAGVALVLFGMLLGSGTARIDPGAARPIPGGGPRLERPDPKDPIVLEPPKAMQAAAPIYVERTVDAGEGTTRVEKVVAGMIKIHSVPETEVVMNGQRLGQVPVFITAPVGKIDFVLESRDAGIYKPIALPLYSGKNPGRMFELNRGWLEVVAPRGSQIWVNGRAVGTAPIRQLELYEGFHRVEVQRPDKTRASKSVEVVPRFTTTHEFTD